MPSNAALASPHHPEPQHRSTEAYVLPRMLDVAPGEPAVVTALLVHEHEVVARGQPVARVRAPGRVRRGARVEEVVVAAPAAGLVVRCWAGPGELVRPDRAILSMTSSEDALVVARFGRAALAHLRRGGEAMALVGAAARAAAAAAWIVSVTDLSDRGVRDDSVPNDPVRVVLRLPSAPAEALWPGTRATIELPA